MSRTLTNYTGVEVPDLTDPQPAASGQISGQVGGNDLVTAIDEHDHSPGKGLPIAVLPRTPSRQIPIYAFRDLDQAVNSVAPYWVTGSPDGISSTVPIGGQTEFRVDLPLPLEEGESISEIRIACSVAAGGSIQLSLRSRTFSGGGTQSGIGSTGIGVSGVFTFPVANPNFNNVNLDNLFVIRVANVISAIAVTIVSLALSVTST